MLIYVQKLSNPLEEWSLDVESSDTIEGVKSKVIDSELPATYELARIHLFKDAIELLNSNTLSDYNIQKNSQLTSSYDASTCDPLFNKFAYGDENGCSRFRRLWSIGYV
jgi:uncharacterized protein with von Willebrand factor type A (vWA) domain